MIGAMYCPNDGVGDHTFATRQFAKEAAKAGADDPDGSEGRADRPLEAAWRQA